MSQLEHAVARLEAINEITNLKHRHMYLADSGFPAVEMADLWCKDGTWQGVYTDDDDPKDHGKLGHHKQYHGISEIRQFWQLNHDLYRWCLHITVCPIIKVAEDLKSATGEWIFLMPAIRDLDGKPTSMWVGGVQRDEYRLEDGSWKFYTIRINIKLVASHDAGWAASRYINEPPV